MVLITMKSNRNLPYIGILKSSVYSSEDNEGVAVEQGSDGYHCVYKASDYCECTSHFWQWTGRFSEFFYAPPQKWDAPVIVGVISLLFMFLLLASLSAIPLHAQDDVGSYTVQSGDTLAVIAERFGSPSMI